MKLNELVEQAAGRTAEVVRGVRPDQLGGPTPCRDWDVRALVNHLLQVVHALNLAGRNEPVPDELWQRDLMAGRWADHFAGDTRAAVTAWADPTGWQGPRGVGGAEMPAPLVATMFASDLVIHGWDLARATGQDYHCDDALAEVTHRFVTDTGDQGRQMAIYAAPLTVAPDAPILDQALALSGRDPRWTPPS